MTPFYLNPPSSLPHEEGNQSQDHLLLTPETLTSSSSCPIYFNSTQEEGNYDEVHHHQHRHKHESNTRFWTVESGGTTSVPTMDNQYYNGSCIKPSRICKREDQYGDPCDNAPVNWMASNMRLMRKMVNSDRRVTNNKLISDAQTCSNNMRSRSGDHEKSNNSTNSVIRVCEDCNTTKTPLWRSGPRGPKSLCNACGIRQRKARRALANGGVVPTDDRSMSNKVSKEKQSESHCTTQQKKRFKRTKNKLRLEDFTISLSKSSAFHPQDERDAAILLMALSYGLVCS